MERTCRFTGDRAAGYAFRTGAALWGFREMGSGLTIKALSNRIFIKHGGLSCSDSLESPPYFIPWIPNALNIKQFLRIDFLYSFHTIFLLLQRSYASPLPVVGLFHFYPG